MSRGEAIEIEITPPPTGPVPVCHVVKGEVVFGRAQDYGRFTTPALELDQLVCSRRQAGPAFVHIAFSLARPRT